MMARRVIAGRGGFSPKSLFAAGEQGVWYDPSDFSTMFQDAAGTTPVTAVEQPVGKILDKSGRGNHATQSANTAYRPILKQDASGKYYLLFDGSNDYLVTPAINFTSTDKMSVFVGLRKPSDTTGRVVIELSNAFYLNSGTFVIAAPGSDLSNSYSIAVRGTIIGDAKIRPFTAPITNVVTQLYNIGGASIADELKARVDGVEKTLEDAAGYCGTGNFGNYPLYIGARGGTSLYFNGHLYSLVVRGAQTSNNLITAAERYVACKTGVTI